MCGYISRENGDEKRSYIACEKVQTVFLEHQRLELEFQNPSLDPERKCFERLGRFSILDLKRLSVAPSGGDLPLASDLKTSLSRSFKR